MNAALRYASLLKGTPAVFHEGAAQKNEPRLTELEIQAHWFAGDFGTEFTSSGGRKVRVLQFGAWNREAGPDFAEAAVSIDGGDPMRGNIEIDMEARDWERHGHATNPDYNGVVLHVCVRGDGREFFIRTAEHREVPRVKIDPATLNTRPPNPLPVAKLGRCSGPLHDMPPATLREILAAAAQFRLGRKSARLARMSELHGEDEALYQALAVTLGYKNNKLPFTILAQRLPLKFLGKREDLDAILFGGAGFLKEADFTKFKPETRSWLRGLWDQWWKVRDDFSRVSLAPDAWRLASVRLANHPQRRVAALAQIIRNWRKIRTLARDGNITSIGEFFGNLRDEFWDFHFTLTSKRSPKRMALIGDTRINDMLANVFYPLVISAKPGRWQDYAKLPAPTASARVKIAAARLLSSSAASREILKNAVNQQGLLQIYEDFCMQDNTDCASCLFPRQIAQWC